MSFKNNKKGKVFWITGLSATGKTTIGRIFYNKLLKKKRKAVFLDGDTMRKVFGDGLGHSISDRKKLAMSYSKLCQLLSEQGLDVVCATISMFHNCHKWNRKNIHDYKEIYLYAPMDVLIKRDKKKLYTGVRKGKVKNVAGVDLKVEVPKRPDVIIKNDGSKSPSNIVREIFSKL